jgi:formiminotetrahydrofolate cyclodeaminase
MRTARLALQAMEQLKIVATQGNHNALADAATGVHMALAAIEGVTLDVLVNLQSVQDVDMVRKMTDEIISLRQVGRELASEIMTAVQRMGDT